MYANAETRYACYVMISEMGFACPDCEQWTYGDLFNLAMVEKSAYYLVVDQWWRKVFAKEALCNLFDEPRVRTTNRELWQHLKALDRLCLFGENDRLKEHVVNARVTREMNALAEERFETAALFDVPLMKKSFKRERREYCARCRCFAEHCCNYVKFVHPTSPDTDLLKTCLTYDGDSDPLRWKFVSPDVLWDMLCYNDYAFCLLMMRRDQIRIDVGTWHAYLANRVDLDCLHAKSNGKSDAYDEKFVTRLLGVHNEQHDCATEVLELKNVYGGWNVACHEFSYEGNASVLRSCDPRRGVMTKTTLCCGREVIVLMENDEIYATTLEVRCSAAADRIYLGSTQRWYLTFDPDRTMLRSRTRYTARLDRNWVDEMSDAIDKAFRSKGYWCYDETSKPPFPGNETGEIYRCSYRRWVKDTGCAADVSLYETYAVERTN